MEKTKAEGTAVDDVEDQRKEEEEDEEEDAYHYTASAMVGYARTRLCPLRRLGASVF